MSIVEKAIQKRRRSTPSSFDSGQGSGVGEQSAKIERDEGTSARREPAGAKAPELPTITIDFKRLAQFGFAPPEEYAERLANEYRQVKRALLDNIEHPADSSANRNARLNRIVVTSAVPGEGKSFTTINLALSLARERDYNVVLVDGDILKPRATQALGLAGKPGFGDLLADEALALEAAVYKTDFSSLWVLPAGRRDPLLAEHLGSRRADQVLAHLSRMRPAQVIVIDSPPLLATAEAPVLAARGGQVVLVVQAGTTAQHVLRAAMGSLREDHMVNLLLNQADRPKWEDYYGHYAGYYGTSS